MKRHISVLACIVCILLLLLSGCQQKAADNRLSGADHSTDFSAQENTDMAKEAGLNDNTTKSYVVDPSRKLIQTVSLDMQTKDFDKLNDAIMQQLFELNGYVENSQHHGNSYQKTNGSRSVSMTLRIPKAQLNQFVTSISELGVIVYKQESTQDVTLTYADIESHKKSLQIQQERLLALLEKAEKLEDIITLEQRLSEVRYELESYESQLRTFDNQVDYATVRLSIYEVDRVVKKDDGSMWGKIATGFSNSLHKIGYGIESFIIWFLSNILYLIIVAAIIVFIVFIIKKAVKNTNAKYPPPPVPINIPQQNNKEIK